MHRVLVSSVAVVRVACSFLAHSRTAIALRKVLPIRQQTFLDARAQALGENESDASSQKVERRLATLYRNPSKDADEVIVVLVSFYLGEHKGEGSYENMLSRGPRMIPLFERCLREELLAY